MIPWVRKKSRPCLRPRNEAAARHPPLLWAAAGTLPKEKEAETLMVSPDNTLYFSPASIWEIGIKKTLGQNDFKVDPEVLWRGLVESHYLELPITAMHTLGVNALPPIHKDPFDRIILAQAKSEGYRS